MHFGLKFTLTIVFISRLSVGEGAKELRTISSDHEGGLLGYGDINTRTEDITIALDDFLQMGGSVFAGLTLDKTEQLSGCWDRSVVAYCEDHLLKSKSF